MASKEVTLLMRELNVGDDHPCARCFPKKKRAVLQLLICKPVYDLSAGDNGIQGTVDTVDRFGQKWVRMFVCASCWDELPRSKEG